MFHEETVANPAAQYALHLTPYTVMMKVLLMPCSAAPRRRALAA